MSRALQILHDALHADDTRVFRVVQGTVWALIVVSVGIFLADLSLPEAHVARPLLDWLDHVLLGVFAVEITLRVATYHPPALDLLELGPLARVRTHVLGRLAYALSPLNLVDIVTVATLVTALRGLRALRLIRLLRGVRLFRYAHPMQGFERAFRDNALLYAFAFSTLGLTILVGGTTIYLAEVDAPESKIHTIAEGIWWAIVTITTVGYGDLTPVSPVGKIVAAVLMVAGMFMLALFAGIVGHTLLHAILSLREEQFRMSTFVNHVVLCGYDPGASMLLEAMSAELDPEAQPVVIFAPRERPPDIPAEYLWVQGDPTKESELDKVRLTHASAVLLVGSRSVPPQIADATTILTAFTIRAYMTKRTLQRKLPLYVAAEILDAENVDHARTAGVDEVVETTRLGFSLMAHALVMHGTANVLSRVVSAGADSLYVGELPSELQGMPFLEVVQRVREQTGALVIGVRDPATLKDTLNPQDGVRLVAPLQIIYLARESVAFELGG